jgi:hypothetical protein
MFCGARHDDEHDHDGKTEPSLPAAEPTNDEGFPF